MKFKFRTSPYSNIMLNYMSILSKSLKSLLRIYFQFLNYVFYIIFLHRYKYDFTLLETNAIVRVDHEDRVVGPLYKHVFSPKAFSQPLLCWYTLSGQLNCTTTIIFSFFNNRDVWANLHASQLILCDICDLHQHLANIIFSCCYIQLWLVFRMALLWFKCTCKCT